jgi:hypothetical protein
VSHSHTTLALVCGVWQCITVIEALLENEISDRDILFIIDLNNSESEMATHIERIIRIFFRDVIVIQIEDVQPNGFREWWTLLKSIRTVCGRKVRQIYVAYPTFVYNIVLAAYRNVDQIVLVDDGIAHYRYLKFIQGYASFSIAKRLLLACGIAYSACRIHGQFNIHDLNRMSYLHIYPCNEVDNRLSSCARPVSHDLLRSVIERSACAFPEHISLLKPDMASHLILGSVSTDEMWSQWESSVLSAVRSQRNHCIYKPHPRSNSGLFDERLIGVVNILRYMPVEIVVSLLPTLTLVGGESSSILNCQLLYGTRHESYADFCASYFSGD